MKILKFQMLQGSGLLNLKGGKRKFNIFSKGCV
jgi:hypothetical protein